MHPPQQVLRLQALVQILDSLLVGSLQLIPPSALLSQPLAQPHQPLLHCRGEEAGRQWQAAAGVLGRTQASWQRRQCAKVAALTMPSCCQLLPCLPLPASPPGQQPTCSALKRPASAMSSPRSAPPSLSLSCRTRASSAASAALAPRMSRTCARAWAAWCRARSPSSARLPPLSRKLRGWSLAKVAAAEGEDAAAPASLLPTREVPARASTGCRRWQ
jgi:hypothetical protein